MRTPRRRFLQLAGGALALALGRGGTARAREETGAPRIHAGTANHRLGPAGRRRPTRLTPLPSFKSYPGAERVALPRPEPGPERALAALVRDPAPGPGFQAGGLDLGQLGRLLHLTNGITGDPRAGLRAAPSAGALYAGEVYVVAERIRDLPPGLYSYAVAEHALLRLRSGSLAGEVLRALESPRALEKAAAFFLLSNVFDRYTWRYANRGYRYALIDSGHIGENLRLAAGAEGLAEAGPRRFHDDALHALLAIDGRAEAVCAVHAVGAPGPSREESGAAAEALRWLGERQELAPGSLRAEGHLTDRYHAATMLVPARAEGPPSAVPPAPAPAAPDLALPAALPPPAAGVGACIRKRRSPGRFLEQSIACEELAFALEMAGGHAALTRTPGVELSLVAHRVRGLAPGLYRFAPAGPGLARVREGEQAQALVRACRGQDHAGRAAVALASVGRFARSRSALGDRSYRDQLLEAGAIAQRIYLAAEAAGLAARNLAAFTDQDLNELFALDGRSEAVLHLTVLGHRA